MVDAKSPHPNCAYEWMNWITTPKVQAEVAEWFGEAPANLKACAEKDMAAHCDTYHADDKAYYDQLSYWTTPTKECLDGRTNVDCVAYKDWAAAWDEIKGS
jgi:putative spermidine/putrescine transport system substrate-binding protein